MTDGVWDATEQDDHAIGELLVAAFERAYARKMPEVVVSEERRAELRRVGAKRAVAKVWVYELGGAGGRHGGGVAVRGARAPKRGFPELSTCATSPSTKRTAEATSRSALLDSAEAHARAIEAPAVCLHVRRGAVGVRRLYESRGYQRRPEGISICFLEVFLEAFALPLR